MLENPRFIERNLGFNNLFLSLRQRQLQKIARWLCGIVRAARDVDVAASIAGGGAEDGAAVGKGSERTPVERLQVEQPGGVEREIQHCIVAADDDQFPLAVRAACGSADMGGSGL